MLTHAGDGEAFGPPRLVYHHGAPEMSKNSRPAAHAPAASVATPPPPTADAGVGPGEHALSTAELAERQGLERRTGADRNDPHSAAHVEDVFEEMERAGLVKRVGEPEQDGLHPSPEILAAHSKAVQAALLDELRADPASQVSRVHQEVIPSPSICRAVVVRRLVSTPDGPIVPSEPVAATVQRADGLVIDCYAVGKLDVDGGGPRGGLHELKGVKHSSLADHDDLYWDYPARV